MQRAAPVGSKTGRSKPKGNILKEENQKSSMSNYQFSIIKTNSRYLTLSIDHCALMIEDCFQDSSGCEKM
jgi:hypothetical protein